MTKIKNTKKGMAKKTLSVSLAVAMLATSNVPVWAAEDLFSAGEAVESPVVVAEEAVDAFGDEAVVETPENVEAAAANEDVNNVKYVADFKINMNAAGWGSEVTVTGSIKDAYGDVEDLNYIWLADGVQAAGTDATGCTDYDNVDSITYTPVKEDFNKTLSLCVFIEDGLAFKKTVTGSKVGAQDVSAYLPVPTVSDVVYNGKEQKVLPSNLAAYSANPYGITSDQYVWNYAVEGNDFTNVTDKKISVTGELTGTYDASSPAYGFKGSTGAATYQITKRSITDENLVASLKTTSLQYTGTIPVFGKSDITLQVKVDDTNRVDITDALKDDVQYTGTGYKVGTGYKANYITTADLNNTEEALAILKNFKYDSATGATLENSYEVTIRDLSECTGEVTKEYTISAFKANPVVNADDIKLTGKDGKSFTLAQMFDEDVNISVNKAAIEAANAGKVGVVADAVTVTYKADTKNVTGTINLPITLTAQSLSAANVEVNVKGVLKTMQTNPKSPLVFEVPYIGKEYDLTAGKYGITGFSVKGVDPTEYTVSYDDNVNAGLVEVTITGTKSYEGSTKKVYFKITPKDKITATAKAGVTINPANNKDAALYKDALEVSVKSTLKDITDAVVSKDVVLTEGTDYTVKYYYATEPDLNTEANIKAYAGDNVVGNYVYAVIKPVKDGNYSFDTETVSAPITKKSISDVTVTVEKESYTYTGAKIVPNVVVKDGSNVLEKGVDYTIAIKDNQNVGTATVTIKPTAGSDYDATTSATATFEITPAKAEDVKVTFGPSASATAVQGKDNTFSYTGKQIKPEIVKIELNGVEVTSQFAVSYKTFGENINAGKEAGSVEVAPKDGNENFTGTKKELFDIQGKELTGTLKVYNANNAEYKNFVYDDDYPTKNLNIIDPDDVHFYYTGKEHTLSAEKFVSDDKTVVEGKDYEIVYVNNVDAGLGFVAVVAKGNYEGTLNEGHWHNLNGECIYMSDGKLMKESGLITSSKTTLLSNVVDIVAFEINASMFTRNNITVTNGVYAGGLPVKPQVTVSVAGKTLEENKDYKLTIVPVNPTMEFVYPDSVVNATEDKPFFVVVEAIGGYAFDDVDGNNSFMWGIDKFDLAAADIKSTGTTVTVKNGSITVDPEEYTTTVDETAGTITVEAKATSKNYTGKQTVKINNVFVEAPMITDVKVVGNKATVVLSGDCDGASGYDYVISKANDYTTDRVAVNKNKLATDTTFTYVQQGVYYAYCHAWTRGEDGKKVFSGWSNVYPFAVTAITPDQPVITSVTTKGSTVTVTYTKAANADGYDVVLGSAVQKVAGENRPVNYGTLVKKNIKGNTVTVTFKDVPAGTYYAGLHAWNRTSEDGKKVFSPWSNTKKVTVK